jgi:DNA-directed RNA polymerase specialized sigma24 family protein
MERRRMAESESVTQWISQLKAGQQEAARALWDRYFSLLVERARSQLGSAPRRAVDEEDVALSAFDSFCRAAAQGRFPNLHDRDELWQMLLVISDRKSWKVARDERRQRRGGGKVLDEAAAAASSEGSPLAAALGREPTPQFAAQVAEEYQRLLDLLGDPDLQRVAVRRMEGYSVAEISHQFGWAPRTVQRRLELIRRIWKKELDD